jgi:anti-sigma-K factor RskA
MSDAMTHEEARERLADIALGVIDASERGRVLAHVAECAICRLELDSLQRTASELAYAVAPVPMAAEQRDRVRARLLARVHADARVQRTADVAVRSPSVLRPVRRARFSRSAWLAAAASIVALASVGAMMRMRSAMTAEKDKTIAALAGPNVAVMKLMPATPRAPSGMMFWDRSRGEWTLVAHNLTMPRAGRSYQLWLVTPKAKISGGMFMPDAHGDAMMQMRYALSADSLAALAVTEEPSSGSSQPTTAPLMVASAATR